MSKKAQILEKLKELSKQHPLIVPAQVVSVDEEALTCIIEIDELQFKARLNGAENSIKGLVIIPTVNSWVLAGRLDENGDVWAVLSFTEADKIVMRNGENGGLINIESLVDIINELQGAINDLKDVFKNWTPVAQDGGAALKAAVTTWTTQKITETETSDIEDSNILH